MAKVKKPWIAFKVMAAGAISPPHRLPLRLPKTVPISSSPACSISRWRRMLRTAIDAIEKAPGARKRPWCG